ncbi:MAG: hypothetical protein BGO67_04185 [Alphaproteobacteria bacterium 41-28]|nr:MAG: hypothetical protein BGO67_04185 [Alphaproteobacteria bacterium 41-28]
MKKLFPLFLSVSILVFNGSTFAMEEKADDTSGSALLVSPLRQIKLGEPLSLDDLKHIAKKGRIQTSGGVFQLIEKESCDPGPAIKQYSMIVQHLFDRECHKVLNCHKEKLAEKDSEILNKLNNGFIYYLATVSNPSVTDEYWPWGGKLAFQKISN